MIEYSRQPVSIVQVDNRSIANFVTDNKGNLDVKTVESFGDEWNRFSDFSEEDLTTAGSQYFDLLDDKIVNQNTIALDIGCGTGRWSKYMARRVKFIEAIDPSDAVYAAAKVLINYSNIRITRAEVDSIPFTDNSFDFVFSLGVLHHIPDTAAAIRKAVEKLKPGGHLLLYLYYRFDNRSLVFKSIFFLSNILRLFISKLPKKLKQWSCDVIATIIYIPLVSFARLIKMISSGSHFYKKIPLSYYADKSFYIMRNDALDRFGTPLEQRFTRKEIDAMLTQCGMDDIRFSDNEPYWHVISRKKIIH